MYLNLPTQAPTPLEILRGANALALFTFGYHIGINFNFVNRIYSEENYFNLVFLKSQCLSIRE
jgi:hypothetical protein